MTRVLAAPPFWGVLGMAALLWPSRLSGRFDGIPLDHVIEAVAFGLVVPALWWLYPAFLRSAVARAAIVALLLVKLGAALVLVQDGWCVSFESPRPMVRDGNNELHSWDMRADWLSRHPACSAVMTRSYRDSFDLPVWFFNLPPPNDAAHSEGYHPGQIDIRMRVQGFIDAGRRGALRLRTHPAMAATMHIDGHQVVRASDEGHEVNLEAGVHSVVIDATLAGKQWQMVPLWDDATLGSAGFAAITTTRPSGLDRLVRPAANWAIGGLAVLLILSWLWAWAWATQLEPRWVGAWTAAASIGIGIAAFRLRVGSEVYVLAAITLALAIPVGQRLRSARTAFLLIGVPWLAYVAGTSAHNVARWTLYEVGNDNFLFQRFSYRIFLQGYWLEGGQQTFWNQPLYRWIAGSLHMVFGDSSVGQSYWDAGGVAVIALFAHHVAGRLAGFKWGLVAATTTIALFLMGPALEFVGFGLSEISSAAFVYLAALLAMRARAGRRSDAIAAGVLATLAFYTRLNNFPMACAVAAFALPLDLPVRSLLRPSAWWSQISWRVVIAIATALGGGLVLLAWRTWYYTGVFSPFHGTQRDFLAVWQPGMPLSVALQRMVSSVMMVLTVSDPPRVVWHAVPLLIAGAISLAGLAGLRGARNVPLPLVVFFLSGLAGALLVRGWGHEGRFSIHLFGVSSAISIWALASVLRSRGAGGGAVPVPSK